MKRASGSYGNAAASAAAAGLSTTTSPNSQHRSPVMSDSKLSGLASSIGRSSNTQSSKDHSNSSGAARSYGTSRGTLRSSHYREPKLEQEITPATDGDDADAAAVSAYPNCNSHLRFVPGRLYGRQAEIKTLLEAAFAPSLRGDSVERVDCGPAINVEVGGASEDTNAVETKTEEGDGVQGSMESTVIEAPLHEPEEPIETSNHSRQISSKKRQRPAKALIFISGESGCGKTALAAQLQRFAEGNDSNNSNSGCFVSGKFDFQQQPAQPYSAIAVALRYLCQYLMLREDSESVLETLYEDLGDTTLRVVATLIPSLLTVFGLEDSQNDTVDNETTVVGMGDAHNRLSYAIARFLRIVSNTIASGGNDDDTGKLILMLDDLQWADSESLLLLEVLARDEESPRLVLVGSYRSNEVSETDLLAKLLRDLKNSAEEGCGGNGGIQLTEIHLENLTLDALHEMISTILQRSMPHTKSLTRIVHQKTLGNPFFVVEFLKSLEARHILDFYMGEWRWDDDDLEANTAATDNVIDLMRDKMSDFDPSLRDILPVAASLGATFSVRLLNIVVENFANTRSEDNHRTEEDGKAKLISMTAGRWVEIMVEAGFLEQCGDFHQYGWAHDKIQESALTLVETGKLQSMRYAIGQRLLANFSPVEFAENIFLVMNLLNECKLVSEMDAEQRKNMSALNLSAAKSSMLAASFQQASAYLQKGIEWLPDNGWQLHYDLTLDLYSTMAEAEFCNGNVESMESHCDAVLKQEARPLEDKFRCYRVLVDSRGNRNLLDEAIDLIVTILKQLDCRFPKRGRMLHVVYEIVHLKTAVKKHTPEQISGLKPMTDPCKIMAMRLLDKLATLAYYADSDLLPLAIFKSFRWSLKYGISEFSPPAFVTVGLILATELEDLQQGRMFAEHALLLLEKMDCTEVAPRTVMTAHTLVLHYATPVVQCRQPCLRAYEAGLGTGDVESAMWAIQTYLQQSIYAGFPLKPLEHDFSVYTKQMREFNQEQTLFCARLDWQLVLLFLGRTEDPLRLVGSVMDSEAVLAEGDNGPHQKFHSAVMGNQVLVAFWFGDDEQGAETALALQKRFPKEIKGPYAACFCHVHNGYLGYTAARKTLSPSNRKKYMKLAQSSHKQIKTWVKNGNPNFLHLDKFLDAAAAAQRGKHSVALGLFHQAVNMAEQAGMKHHQALFNERFGDYRHDTGGQKLDITDCWQAALGLYREWGAVAKVDQVKEKLVGVEKGPVTLVEVKEGVTDTCSLSMGDGVPARRFWR